MKCRFCKSELSHVFIDLGNAPASNSFLSPNQLNEPEVYYPLKVYNCEKCFLVQLDEYKSSESIFNNEYVYFSSYSSSWLEHARAYTEKMSSLLNLSSRSRVVEIASNDGYLLQYFKAKDIPVLGIEPTANTAAVAKNKGIPTITEFFGAAFAEKYSRENNFKADLLLGNNVLAHVPDIVDFIRGMKHFLAPGGTITMEFPHLLQLISQNQFDTIYHEHFSYLSFYTVNEIFSAEGLELFNVEELPTHGGSLRIFAKHKEDTSRVVLQVVPDLIQKEKEFGLTSAEGYAGFQEKAFSVKLQLLDFLVNKRKSGARVAAYGAAAKGNTLLNYCGIKSDLIDYVIDANPNKQGKFLPASHIPVRSEEYLKKDKPDFVIILPWNLKTEITNQLCYIKDWGGRFVITIPQLNIF
jgi:SAM-dependent methyltransferase